MPRATVDIQDTKKFDLKTLPDGYVVIRRMSYGEFLRRQDMSMDMGMQGAMSGDANAELKFGLNQGKLAEYEFGVCIVEHNLEDHTGQPLSFKNAQHIKQLDPRVGQEISQYIGQMNNLGEEPLGNSNGSSAPATSEER